MVILSRERTPMGHRMGSMPVGRQGRLTWGNSIRKFMVVMMLAEMPQLAISRGEDVWSDTSKLGTETIARLSHGFVLRPQRLVTSADGNFFLAKFLVKIPRPPKMGTLDALHFCTKITSNKSGKGNHPKEEKEALFKACTRISDIAFGMYRNLANIRLKMKTTYEEVIKLLPDKLWRGGERRKRGLLNFIGNFAYYLFGTGRAKDTDRNFKLIKDTRMGLFKVAEAVASDEKVIGHFMNISTDRINELSEVALKHGKHIKVMERNLETMFNVTLDTYKERKIMDHYILWLSHIMEVGHALTLAYTTMYTEVKAFQQGVHELMKGELSPSIVPFKDMEAALGMVSATLEDRFPGHHVAFKSPAFYYDNANPTFVRKHDVLYISVPIPIVANHYIFRVYHVHTLPVPIHFENATKPDATILRMPYKTVALSIDGTLVLHIDNTEWRDCKGDEILICPDLVHYSKLVDDKCLHSLISNSDQNVEVFCNKEYVWRYKFYEQIIHLTGSQILVSTPDTNVTIFCAGRLDNIVDLFNYAILDLQCDCGMRTSISFVPPQMGNCEKMEATKEITLPENYILQHLGELTVNRSASTSLIRRLRLKPLKVVKDLVGTEKLGNVVMPYGMALRALRTSEVMDLTSLGDDSLRLGWRWMAIFMWIPPFLMMSALMAMIFKRLLTIQAMLVVGSTLPAMVEGVGCTLRPDRDIWLLYMVNTFVLLGVVASVILTVLLMRRWARSGSDQHICIQFAGGTEVITVGLSDNGYGAQSLFWTGRNLIRRMTVVKYWWKYYLDIDWDCNLKIIGHSYDPHEITRLELPTSVKISGSRARKLLRIPVSKCFARLIRDFEGMMVPIPRGLPRVETVGWDKLLRHGRNPGAGRRAPQPHSDEGHQPMAEGVDPEQPEPPPYEGSCFVSMVRPTLVGAPPRYVAALGPRNESRV